MNVYSGILDPEPGERPKKVGEMATVSGEKVKF